jgi:hypothetical protein
MSIDGGATWSDVAVGTYIYEFADWGGLVIMARHSGGTEKAAGAKLLQLCMGMAWHWRRLGSGV